MSDRTIQITCECGHVNEFPESELISGMTIKDDQGRIVEEHPEVTIDENTFVQCEACGTPVSCANATISD